MKIRTLSIAIVAVAWTLGVAVAHSSSALNAGGIQEPSDKPSQEDADSRAKEVFVRVCTPCHTLEEVTSARKTTTEWRETIEKMIARGATSSEEDFATALKYLASQFGRVNVNRAKAADLAAVLGLSEKQAEAIVKYREEHGTFADFDALKQVPGLDVEKLEKKKDAISY